MRLLIFILTAIVMAGCQNATEVPSYDQFLHEGVKWAIVAEVDATWILPIPAKGRNSLCCKECGGFIGQKG